MRAIFIIIASFFFAKSYAQGDFSELQSNPASGSLHIYEEDGKMGLQKNARRQVTPAIYDTLVQIADNRYVGKRFSANKQAYLWGMLNTSGTILLPFNYFTFEVFGSKLIFGSAENNRIRKGVYDLEGNEIVSPRYETIKISTGYIIARAGSSNNIFSETGTKIMEYQADSIEFLDRQHLVIYQDGKAGLQSLDGTISLPKEYQGIRIEDGDIFGKRFPKWMVITGYDTTVFFRQEINAWGERFIAKAGTKSQLLNDGRSKISATYDIIRPVSGQLATVSIDDRWGVIDNNGKEVIPVKYSNIITDDDFLGVKTISNKSKWQVFDLYGYSKTQLTYDSLRPMSSGRIPVKRNGRWGYLDRYGVEIISPIFEEAHSFINDMAHVRFFGQSGIIDRSGNWVVPPINRRILDFNSQIILTKFRDQYHVLSYQDELVYFTSNRLRIVASGIEELDSTGQFIRKISWEGTIITDIYSGESIRTGGSGLTIFRANGRFGFKDQQGRIIIANRYEDVKPFHQRMAAIKIRNKWGFIDLDEIIRVQPIYDSVGHFVNGRCLVKKGDYTGVIDTRGKEIISPKYSQIYRLGNGYFRVAVNGKWGLIGESGEVVIHPKYDMLESTDQGYYIVRRGNKYGSIGETGINQIPIIYDFVKYDSASRTLSIKEAQKQEWAFIMKTHLAN